ncbi:DUF47 family protein [Sphingomonas astaxanthinifaciens]|uniref:Nudix hydrolase domain-containing protein n=1 Tax=Sphingomonas astaxanthinifaciens DSM 22298 TaxID=1123267 RepID=A0ABQ5ZBV0_9SPHN|nr:DUF47 family protein [Sphingomonas astaxanthinifaciens]GLR48082.1 hypothetical protein GCM10007925_17950 [Sphingomonas astaxanthinifaciens DSM 22298]
MPYRLGGSTLDAPVSVLLVTSRETRRWVIPKGNPSASLAPHTAAALEAEEEAGVRGAVCPVPLGSYRYRKRRKTGASLMFDVDVYPMSVDEELTRWKEADERTRRWFTLNEAADAVEEEDLAALIRSFNAAEFNSAARRKSLFTVVAERSKVGPMFAWFQNLLPKTGNFFELFEAHAESVCGAARALGRLFSEGGARAEHIREISEREHDADNIIRETLGTVRRTFLTPFDRGAITSLISAMDNAIDEMQAAANAVDLYDFSEFEPEMKDMVGIIIDSGRLMAEALPLLRNVGSNAGRLHELTERLVRMEGHADETHRAGLKSAFQRFGSDPAGAMQFTVRREIYKHLERIVDAFEDVANEIDGIVIDHA